MKTFGEQLRLLRKNSGLSLAKVAKQMAIDVSLLAKIERNERNPTKAHIKQLAQIFGVKERDLEMDYLSDQIAFRILDEDADLFILKVAEEKVKYLKTVNYGK